MNKKIILCVAILICIAPHVAITASPSITRTTGIITIPTAYTVNSGELIFGAGYLPAKYAVLRQNRFGDQIYYMTLGYLPFLETTGGIVRSDNVGKRWGIGDRIVFFRFKIISEKDKFPAVVLGFHDPLGFIGEAPAQHYNASYLVASKSFGPANASAMYLHLGYGVDWIRAGHHQFVGFFGGVEFLPLPFLSYSLEYDAKRFNAGLHVDFLNRFQGTISLFGLETFGGGISYRIKL